MMFSANTNNPSINSTEYNPIKKQINFVLYAEITLHFALVCTRTVEYDNLLNRTGIPGGRM